jgi:DHA3 family macrolide efflux protein-like MFS transporter
MSNNNWKKNTVLFLGGQALSIFGSMVVQYAIMWHIILKTQSGVMMSIFSIVGFLPMFLISPFGGVWADRFNRKYLINISDGAIALASLIVAVLLFLGYDHIGILFACAAIRSFGQGVQSPAVGAFIPQIVPAEHLTRVNGIQSSIQSLCMFVAPMISAALMAFAPLATLFLLDVVTAGIGIAILFFFVKAPKIETVEAVNAEDTDRKEIAVSGIDYFRDVKEGFKYIRTQGYISRLVILVAVFSFLSAPTAFLTPLQVARNFGEEVWRLSSVEIAFSVGMVLGGILIGFWGGFKNKIYTIAFAGFLFSLEAVGLGLSRNFWLYIAIMAAAGMTAPFYNTPSMVLLQTKVDPAFMGRVMSVITMTGSVMMPLGMLIFGPLADIISIDYLLIATGILMLFMGIPILASKQLREAGKV